LRSLANVLCHCPRCAGRSLIPESGGSHRPFCLWCGWRETDAHTPASFDAYREVVASMHNLNHVLALRVRVRNPPLFF
jgi:hypothetical protein